ncbi:hypothetical protein QTO34_000269 [Cnephaeus nilssonii]|uniref:Uncharacterized protein n=1 Tax=Cnephaeus nilssonii TaxID=3371016 RepID=A0AA40IBA4_CNENI|nr:hypothetical protein QTO34_000269 [Eptesicus nilssonii]
MPRDNLTLDRYLANCIPVGTLCPKGQGLGKGLEKGAPQAYLEGTLSSILTTPTALKVAGLNTWIHHSRVKAAHQPSDAQPEWKVTSDQKHPLTQAQHPTGRLPDELCNSTLKAENTTWYSPAGTFYVDKDNSMVITRGKVGWELEEEALAVLAPAASTGAIARTHCWYPALVPIAPEGFSTSPCS